MIMKLNNTLALSVLLTALPVLAADCHVALNDENLTINQDYFEKSHDTENPAAVLFAAPSEGSVSLKVWPKD